MILLMILTLMLIILIAFIILVVAGIGSIGIVIFGDVIVCIIVIAAVIKWLLSRGR